MAFTDLGSTLIGRKILCTAERFGNCRVVSTGGRHNAQRICAYGSDERPAYAVINAPITNYKKVKASSNEHYNPKDDVEGEEILGTFEKDPQLTSLGNESRAKFKGNPAEASVSKKIEWIGS